MMEEKGIRISKWSDENFLRGVFFFLILALALWEIKAGKADLGF